MSLDPRKLENVVELAGGGIQARCPACAEGGHDRKGEHLRVYADGRFGCCVYPKDREHRKRIHALAGSHGPKTIRVKVASAKPATPVKASVLGRLGRLFESPTEESRKAIDQFGTAGTPFSYSRAYTREDDKKEIIDRALKEFEEPVPSVPESEEKVRPCGHAEDGEQSEEDLERKMNESPY